jgi:hypothetical protein
VHVSDRQTGNRVEIEVKIPDRTFSFGDRSVQVDVLVPREIAADVKTGDGAIRVEGVRGWMRLNTGDGGIDAVTVDGSLEAHSGDGHVNARGRFDLIGVHTGDGGIDLDVQAGSKMSGPWRVQSGDGSVHVRLPGDFAADLDMHTGDGHVSLEFPMTVQGVHSESTVRGKINGGGPVLTVRTGDGGIRLDRQ